MCISCLQTGAQLAFADSAASANNAKTSWRASLGSPAPGLCSRSQHVVASSVSGSASRPRATSTFDQARSNLRARDSHPNRSIATAAPETAATTSTRVACRRLPLVRRKTRRNAAADSLGRPSRLKAVPSRKCGVGSSGAKSVAAANSTAANGSFPNRCNASPSAQWAWLRKPLATSAGKLRNACQASAASAQRSSSEHRRALSKSCQL
mmetsp:Transcript_83162/g.269227  ORF Transcript_83162/g.269227 Transcript_83162/m.269227 type:complete len:209 (-) Transcript_83162:160-786(-)